MQTQKRKNPLNDENLDFIAERFRLLSQPLRLKIIGVLFEGRQNVGTIVEQLQSSQANVSAHLGVLSRGGLLQREREGTTIYYSIKDPSLKKLCQCVCESL